MKPPNGTFGAPGHGLPLGWQTRCDKTPIGFGAGSPARDRKPGKMQLYESSDNEGHIITVAPTGKGKGRAAVIPALLEYPGSMVVIDPKGEAAAVTAGHRRKMGQQVVTIAPVGANGEEAGGLNPFDVSKLLNQPVEEAAMEAVEMLHHGMPQSLQDPFWDIKADSLVAGITSFVLQSEPPEECNFLKVRDHLMSDDVVYSLAVLMDTRSKEMPKFAKQQIAVFLQCEEKCRSGILATAQQHFGTLYGESVEQSLRKTTFDLAAFRDGQPTTIYLVLPPSKLKTHGRLLRMWVASLMSVVMSRTCRPELATLFILDEAAQLGEMEAIRTLMTLMRAWGARVWLFLQDLSQIKRLYKDWETLLNNASTMQVFGATTHLAAKALAEALGDGVTASDILSLPADELYLLESPGRVARLRKLDYLRDPMFRGLFAANPLYARQAGDRAAEIR